MCKLCYDNMSDETFAEQIDVCLSNPEYEKWNTTSLSFMIIGACMQKQPETRAKCIRLLEMYLQWRHKCTILFVYDWYDYNCPKHGCELMYSKPQMKAAISKLIEFNEDYVFDMHETYMKEVGAILENNKTPNHKGTNFEIKEVDVRPPMVRLT